MRVLQQFAIALTPFILNADSFPLLSMQNPSTTIRFEYLGQNAKGFCDRVLVPDHKNLSHFGCVKASGFNDRKASCIELILHALRSLNRESFHVSPNVKDFCGRALAMPLILNVELPPVPAVQEAPVITEVEVAPAPVAQKTPITTQVEASPDQTSIQEIPQDVNSHEADDNLCLSPFHIMHIDVRHTESKGVGYKNGYTTLEGFGIYDAYPAFMPFFDLRGHVFNDGKFAGNFGLGERTYIPSINHLIGLYCYYDVRQEEHDLTVQQVSPGIELFGRRMEYRINGYFPVGKDKSHRYDPRFYKFDGHHLWMKKSRKYAMTGADAEIGAHFMQSTRHDVYTGFGPYYFTADPVSAWGGKARFLWRYKAYISLEASYSYDHLFKNIVQGTIGFSYPFGAKLRRQGKNCPNNSDLALSRIAFAPYRFEIPVVRKKSQKERAVNPATGQLFKVWFVDNTSHSAGTYESPFPTLAEAQNASGPNDMIYLFPGDGTTGGMNRGITLQDGQFLFGSGVSHRVNTKQGRIVIPPFSTLSPKLTSAASVITLASGNEVSGLDIFVSQSGGVGIDGRADVVGGGPGINGANINQNTISGGTNFGAIFVYGKGNFSIVNNRLIGGTSSTGVESQIQDKEFANINILNNTISGFGTTMEVTPQLNPTTAALNLLIAGNQISSFTQRGIAYTTGGPGNTTHILNNTVIDNVPTNTFNDAIFVDVNNIGGGGSIVISQNHIILSTSTAGSTAIFSQVGLNRASLTHMEITNNVIETTTSGAVGINLSASSTNTICTTQLSGNQITQTNNGQGISVNANGIINIGSFTNNTSPKITILAPGVVNIQEFSNNMTPSFTLSGNMNLGVEGTCQ